MTTNPNKDYSRDGEIDQLLQLAKALNLDAGDIEKSGSELNFTAIRSKNLLISQRLDSRTLFIQDFRYGSEEGSGVYKGADKDLIKMGKQVFEALDLPVEEAEEWQVLTEQNQEAQIDKNEKVKMGRITSGAKILRVSRRVEGIPIWSSNITLRLSSEGSIVFLQAHWPEVLKATLEEGCRLDYLVRHGWQAPAQEGASPEAVEAGIRHSPPIAFVMDAYPAIRVIYEPWNQRFGRKLTLYFDRHGREIPNVRHVEQLPELESQPRSPKKDHKDC